MISLPAAGGIIPEQPAKGCSAHETQHADPHRNWRPVNGNGCIRNNPVEVKEGNYNEDASGQAHEEHFEIHIIWVLICSLTAIIMEHATKIIIFPARNNIIPRFFAFSQVICNFALPKNPLWFSWLESRTCGINHKIKDDGKKQEQFLLSSAG
jgi:hypothetical protein